MTWREWFSEIIDALFEREMKMYDYPIKIYEPYFHKKSV
jgi:hypothetical protein